MKNLILKHFIRPFLSAPPRPATKSAKPTVQDIMSETQRELALFASDMMGAQTYWGQFGTEEHPRDSARVDRSLFRDLIEATSEAFMVLDPRPGLHIVDINEAYAAATLTARSAVAGSRLFDIFPDNPEMPDADGVSNLYESIKQASQSGEPHTMAIQRYDVRDEDGSFVERRWQPVNTPIYDESGRLIFVLHRAGALL